MTKREYHDQFIQIRVTAEQKKQIQEAARKNFLPMSVFARVQVLKATQKINKN